MQAFRAGLIFLATLALASSPSRAAEWETSTGQKFEGTLTGVYGSFAVISTPRQSRVIPIQDLADASLPGIVDHLERQPAVASSWKDAGGAVTRAVKGKLQVLREGKLINFDPGDRPEPPLYLVYFGADWCPPCRAFSPKLRAAYERLQQLAPGSFELLYISSDRSATEQLKYVRDVGMSWPVLKFSQVGRVDLLERWQGRGIPCLVALTRQGELLLHSYRGEEYIGPHSVLESFEALLLAMQPGYPATRRALHRVALLRHVRAAGSGNRGPAPYLVPLDPRRYRSLQGKSVTVRLELDERGGVRDVQVPAELSAVVGYQLQQDAADWLFLPEVANGQPVRRRVELPLVLGEG